MTPCTQLTWILNTISKNKLFLGENKDFQVPEENIKDANNDDRVK